MSPSTGTCESCGSQATDLAPVRRVYVTPERWDTEARADLQPEPEMWCFPCRSMYPHVAEEDGTP